MYLSPEAKELLTELGVDPAKLEIPDPNDHTVDVLGVIANDFARHQAALTAALRSLAYEIETALGGRTPINPLSSCTEVRRHDEAFHAIQALRSPLHAAVAAWKRANSETTKEDGK